MKSSKIQKHTKGTKFPTMTVESFCTITPECTFKTSFSHQSLPSAPLPYDDDDVNLAKLKWLLQALYDQSGTCLSLIKVLKSVNDKNQIN